ncbi:hypothetical protein [Iodobacter fluviatilis]|uniref:HEPN AbiU2-like domain-containing protein n=1 Tax=Iodobacter fluviatilis TaxID=537 RepID=A0A377Q649_9NEIS|nr:hypothetical protein [Iodobacter fluviatilis]TCU86945.1 hypothetical protein EV682_10570 [Iodobacter fluviatilis]STQ90277.1 Uncharacterised protein [Iodobacter fluviatilis]
MPHIAQNTALPKVKIATRLAMANRDLLEAAGFLDALEKLPVSLGDKAADAALRQSLLSSAVVSYCRPFGANNGAGIATNQISIDLFPSVDKTLHTKLMSLRNKAIAHSDADIVPVQLLDHDKIGWLLVAELPFELAKEVSATRLNSHISTILGQLQEKLHVLSDELRKVPGALGQKVAITFGDLGNDETGQKE